MGGAPAHGSHDAVFEIGFCVFFLMLVSFWAGFYARDRYQRKWLDK